MPYQGGQYPQQQYPQQGPGAPQQFGAPAYPGAYPQQPYQGQPQYPAAPYGAPQQPGAQYPGAPQFPSPAAYQGGYGAPMPGAQMPGAPQYPQQQYPPQQHPQPGMPQYGQPQYAPPPPQQYGQPAYGQPAYPPQPPAQPPPFRGAAQPIPGQQMPGQPMPGQYPGAPQYPGVPGGAAPRPPQAPWAGGTFAAPGLPPAVAPTNRQQPPSVPQNPAASPPTAPKAAAPKPAVAGPTPNGAAPPPAAPPTTKPKDQQNPSAPDGKGRSQSAAAPAAKSAPTSRSAPDAKPSTGPTIGIPAPKPSSSTSPASIAAAARAAEAVAGPAVRQEYDPDDDIEDPVDVLKRNAVPLLVSFVVNLVLIIVLGLIRNHVVPTKEYALEASFDSPGKESLAEIRSLAEATETLEMPDQRPLAAPPEVPKAVKLTVDPIGSAPSPALVPPSSLLPAAMAGRGISGGMKQSLVNSKGGSQQTESAVDYGLQWLAFHQMPNGMWNLTGDGAAGKGKYSKGSKFENHEAATAMALLAFFGAGHTPNNGSKHAKAIDAGVKALLRSQDAKGNFFQGKKADDWMYSHALCTMAVCEYLALEPTNTSLRAPCEKAVRFCIESQHDWGGWRYTPRGDSDTSVTGWMLMALQSAKNAKIKVPQDVFDRIGGYLDRAQQGLPAAVDARAVLATKDMQQVRTDLGSRYSYQPGMDYDHVMTAEGLLCRMYLGWKHDDPRLKQGCSFLLEQHLPTWEQRDVYYWYYGTQAMFHMEGEYWAKWNATLRDMLVANQEQSGPEKGSWNPLGGGQLQQDGADLWSMNNAGGRLYVTCFSLYMLEVYYRHLPLYSELKKQMESRQPTQ